MSRGKLNDINRLGTLGYLGVHGGLQPPVFEHFFGCHGEEEVVGYLVSGAQR